MNISFLTVVLLLAIAITACSAQQEPASSSLETTVIDATSQLDKKQIRATFDGYRAAVLANEGQQAASFVDSKTIQYYAGLLENTLTADSTEIESLTLLDKVMVLMMRHRLPEEKLLSTNGKGLLVYALDEGMISKSSVENNVLGQIEIIEEYANGEILVNNESSPVKFGFSKEDDKWLLDLTAVFPIGEIAFQKMVEDSNQAENDYLFFLLELIKGERPTAQIWQPIK
ncbi:MAG: hypothetical protein AB8F78_01645 [Saprospiraceae bacterium]